MKKLLIAVLSMAALASCAQEDVVYNNDNNAITFGSAYVGSSVRADAATDPSYSTATLTKFNVYGAVNGVNIFDGDEVSGTVGANVWNFTDSNTPKQYWIAGAPYKFVAVVDGNKTVDATVITETNLDAAGLPTSINYTVDGKTDLLCEVVDIASAAANQGVVGFTFSHLLSKVKFSVHNTTEAEADNYRIVLTSAKITNVYEDGVYTVAADAWTPGSTMREYVLENLIINSAATQYHSSEVLLIPGAAKVGVAIEAEIQATSDGGTTWTAVSTASKTVTDVIALEKGKAYNFIVELGIGKEIKFTATALTDWDTTTPDQTL